MSTEVTRRVEIVNRKGLHARASAKLAALAASLPDKITVAHNGEVADARSIMDLLCLTAHLGTTVELTASGTNAKASLDAIESLITNGFGELDDDAASLSSETSQA